MNRYQVILDTYPSSQYRERMGKGSVYFIQEADNRQDALEAAKSKFNQGVYTSSVFPLDTSEKGIQDTRF